MEDLILDRADDNYESTAEYNGIFECLNCGTKVLIDCDELPPCPTCFNLTFVQI